YLRDGTAHLHRLGSLAVERTSDHSPEAERKLNEGKQDQHDSKEGDVPNKRANQIGAESIERQIGQARPKVQVSAPGGEFVVAAGYVSDKYCRRKQWECFKKVVGRALKSPGDTNER